jgi:predicted P-loop ATPase/GTPase
VNHSNGEQLSGLELKTTEEPYGIILNYTNVEKSEYIESDYRELALYNATYILALVKNADWVKFNFIQQEYKVTREELQSLYGKDIRQFNNEEELSNFLQKNLENRK